MSQSTEIRPSILANTLAEEAAREELNGEKTNQSLKESWIQLASQLEIDGVEKHKISTIGQQLIIDQKKKQLTKLGATKEELVTVGISGWWREVMGDLGYTDSKYSSLEATVPSPENDSIYTENGSFIDILTLQKKVIDLAISKFKEIDDWEKTLFTKKETREYYRQQITMLNNFKNAFDEKTKVPQNTEHILLDALATSASVSDGAEKFQLYKIELQKSLNKKFLTTKQATRYQKGDKTSTLPLLKPYTRDEAVYLDYFGVECVTCKSWRVRQKNDSNKVECYDCGADFMAKSASKCRYCQIPLYKEDLSHIVKTGKCENCNTENDLPLELITYAKS